MDRLVLASALVAMAVAVAVVLSRRRPDPPTRRGYTVPVQVDRQDFVSPDSPWLVAVFTSATCDSCAGVLAKAEPMASDAVAVADVEVGSQPDVHARYGIDAVPTTIVADHDGVVRASFVGPVTATDLWAAVAKAREEPNW